MLRDFSDNNMAKDLERVRELLDQKRILEARIVQQIIDFEDEYKVIIDKVRFQRLVTRSPQTIYTELTLLVE